MLCDTGIGSDISLDDIAAIVFPFQTTNLFQAVNLSFFNAFKTLRDIAHGDFSDE
jgi:hypothetical protein